MFNQSDTFRAGPNASMSTPLPLPGSANRLHRPEILSSSSLPSTSGLYQPHHSSSFTNFHRAPSLRPEFRKSSSQPTRSISPPTLRSPSSATNFMPSAGSSSKFLRQSAMCANRALNLKRHLPIVPALAQSNTVQAPVQQASMYSQMGGSYDASMNTAGFMPALAPTGYSSYTSMHQPSIENVITPQAIYSDSEVMMKPVFGNRPLYGHPQQQQRQNRYQQQQYRSSDDVMRGNVSDGGYVQHRAMTAGQHPLIHQHSANSDGGGIHRRPSNYPRSTEMYSESDSMQSPTRPSRQGLVRHGGRHSASNHPQPADHYNQPQSASANVNYYALKNVDDEEDTTEFDDRESDEQPHQRHRQRKHSESANSGKRRESITATKTTDHHHHHPRQNSINNNRRSSRSAGSHSRSMEGSGEASGNVAPAPNASSSRGSALARVHHPGDSEMGDDSETESSVSKNSNSAFTGRPKGIRTLG